MNKPQEEGVYLIKKVKDFPTKRINANFLYTKDYKTYKVPDQEGGLKTLDFNIDKPLEIEDSASALISGTGLEGDPITITIIDKAVEVADTLSTTITGTGLTGSPITVEVIKKSFTALLEYNGTTWTVTSDDISPANITVTKNPSNVVTVDHPNIVLDGISNINFSPIIPGTEAVSTTMTNVSPITAEIKHTTLASIIANYNIPAGYKAYYTRTGYFTETIV